MTQKVDIERLDRMVEDIEAHRVQRSAGKVRPPADGKVWEQMTWRRLGARILDGLELTQCATTMCAAGFVCDSNGTVWLTDCNVEDYLYRTYMNYVVANKDDKAWLVEEYGEEQARDFIETATLRDGEVVDIIEASVRARRLLGISSADADRLFEGDNDLKDIKRIVRRIKAKAAKAVTV